MSQVRSYSSGNRKIGSLVREFGNLYRYSRENAERARTSIDDLRRVESLVQDSFGVEVSDFDILEIGPGQYLSQTRYLALHNRVVAIDLDIIAQGYSPIPYLRMLVCNGLARTVKTMGRKLLGVDRRYAAELRRQLHVLRLPQVKVLAMDACHMSFPDNSFDFVYARSVFHHLPDPNAALEGIVRVLRPAGCAYILLHLYTSETGCLDPRIYTDRRHEVLGWPHLRPQLQGTFDSQNVYLNKLRLNEWKSLFEAKMRGAQFLTTRGEDSAVKAAELLHAQGELHEYSVEELTTVDLAVLWRKPVDNNRELPSPTEELALTSS